MSDRHRRVTVEVRVPFDSNPQAVKELLLKTARNLPEVMKKPEPFLSFLGIGESAMEINLYCWISNVDNIYNYGTSIRTAVYDALLEAGYEIPVPKTNVQLKTEKENKEAKKDAIDDEKELDK